MNEIKITNGAHVYEFINDEISLVCENVNADVFLKVLGNGIKKLNLNALNTNLNLFVWIESESAVLTENYDINKNSNVTISVVDVYTKTMARKATATCNGAFSKLIFNNVNLSDGNKNIDIKVKNNTAETDIKMENFTVATENSSMEMLACGVVAKGAKRSKNFQENHCLTIGKVSKLNIQPQLIIDENDVEAGHGSSIGDVDDETMYYLNSRGLTKKEALSLIVHSFLCTVTQNILNKELKTEVLQKIEKRALTYA